ncbi:hypothetical protein [Lacimicrobium alkaliphilum]|uniref:Bacterial OB-fold domain-containing protein n=1 Tax=Lacimicrobium alkaliphilum TaxID=1526571 RepID=A0A0U3AN01_9ALTE|nr:hypothetical protein [Lacimicrobium alkaliphilum]ALS99330.1 hypothetical protein AT746_14395 [Lacimicrobium alkaliphilum]
MRFMKSLLSVALASAVVAPAMAKNPYARPDGSWISLNGTVVESDADGFILDYGEGIVTVEMDDWDWYGDAYPILGGDQVKVNGRVDDDLYETTSIEANSVYVKDLNTYFYANDADEEALLAPDMTTVYIDNDLRLTGTVTKVDGREFTIDTGRREVTVDTSQMLYNPMDDKGFQQIDKGEFVSVTGDFDIGIFESNELVAESITTLYRDKTKNADS